MLIQIGQAPKIIELFSCSINSTSDVDSTEHEISTAHKIKYQQKKKFFALDIVDVVFIMLINVTILPFMSAQLSQ